MLIDNFDNIYNILKDDCKYLIYLHSRTIDNPNINDNVLNESSECLKGFWVYSKQEIEEYKKSLIAKSIETNSRLYIYLAPINAIDICTFNELIDSIALEDTYYLIDCDTKDNDFVNSLKTCLYESYPIGDKRIIEIPTIKGYHIVMKPFNPKKFHDEFPGIYCLRNSGILLYYDKSDKI